jgi:hypothetical protein
MNEQTKSQAVALAALSFTPNMTTADVLQALGRLYDAGHSQGIIIGIDKAQSIVDLAFKRTPVLIPHAT